MTDDTIVIKAPAGMTPAQFTALAELLRLRAGPSAEAARLVLVDGLTTGDAGRAVGLSYPQAYKAVKRAKDGLTLAKAATLAAVTSTTERTTP